MFCREFPLLSDLTVFFVWQAGTINFHTLFLTLLYLSPLALVACSKLIFADLQAFYIHFTPWGYLAFYKVYSTWLWQWTFRLSFPLLVVFIITLSQGSFTNAFLLPVFCLNYYLSILILMYLISDCITCWVIVLLDPLLFDYMYAGSFASQWFV